MCGLPPAIPVRRVDVHMG